MIRKVQINVTTTGSAGSASGNTTTSRAYNGEVVAIRIDWHASAPGATSDIVITGVSDDDTPTVTLASIADSATDTWVYPKVQSTDTAGSAIAAQYQHPVIDHRIDVAIAQSNALTNAAVVTVFIKEDR